jgi:Planctomycete cytochrome C
MELRAQRRRVGRLPPLLLALAIAGLMTVGCGTESPDQSCVTLPDTCAPSFNTDYDTVYKNLFRQRCGTGSGVTSCHGADGQQGGLTLDDPDAAYDALLGSGHVTPGDAECSPLMVRLETDDSTKRMPRGEAKLPEGVRCAVQRWIAAGAPR